MAAPTKTMTAAALRTVILAFIKAWNDHDVDAILAKVTPDVIWENPNLPGPVHVVHGGEAVAADLRAGFTAYPDLHMAMEDLHVYSTNDPVVGFSTWTATGTMTGPMAGMAPTGKLFRIRGACVYKFRDGLIAEHTMVYDGMDIARQIGLIPSENDFSFKMLAQVQRLTTKTRKVLHV